MRIGTRTIHKVPFVTPSMRHRCFRRRRRWGPGNGALRARVYQSHGSLCDLESQVTVLRGADELSSCIRSRRRRTDSFLFSWWESLNS
jgi:hypothetical protein